MNDRETTGGGSRLDRETTASLVWRLDALLWLVVPGTIAGLMSDDTLSAYWPGLVIPGEILGFLCTVAYGLFLLKLAGVNERYRTAGICLLVSTVVSTPVTLLAFGAAWTLVVLLPVAWLLSHTGNLTLVWLAFPIAEGASLLLCVLFLRHTYRTVVAPLDKPI